MRLSDNLDIIYAIMIAYIAIAASTVLGYSLGKSINQKEAVRVGVAEYDSDSNGDSVFKWLDRRKACYSECSCGSCFCRKHE